MLKIFDRYIIRKFLGTFFYAISLLIIIVIIFDISENIDSFIEKEAPLKAIVVDYYLNFIPYFINLFVYLFTFISVIFFTSKLAGNTEIIAILSSGVSFRRLLYPYMISAVLLAIMSYYLGNFLIPETNKHRRVFKGMYMEDLTKDAAKNLHIQIAPNTFAYIETYNNNIRKGYKFSIEKFEGQKLVYKLMADQLILDTANHNTDNGYGWKIKNYYIRTIDSNGQSLVKGVELDTVFSIQPEDLYKIKEKFEEMNYFELNDFIEKEKAKGSNIYKKYEIEKYKRTSGPVAIIILTIIGVSLSSRKVRGGIGMHLGVGIALTFSYILLIQVSTVFSTFGNLSPIAASWIPNIIFTVIAIVLLQKAPK